MEVLLDPSVSFLLFSQPSQPSSLPSTRYTIIAVLCPYFRPLAYSAHTHAEPSVALDPSVQCMNIAGELFVGYQ